VRKFEDILQDVNALFVRAEAKPPYSIDLLDKGAQVKIELSQSPGGTDKSIEHSAKDRLLEDDNVLIGGIRDKQGRNLIEPWADSHSLFAGFRGNFDLLTKSPVLLYEILELFVEQPELEPPKVVQVVPPVPPVRLKNLPSVGKDKET
jgi:hypothetical protein